MSNKTFAVDLTLVCDPDRIEELFEALCCTADEFGALVSQYRYYVPLDVKES